MAMYVYLILMAIGTSVVVQEWRKIYPWLIKALWHHSLKDSVKAEILKRATLALYLGDREPRVACWQIVELLDRDLAQLVNDDPEAAAKLCNPGLVED
jgi:hypothetical protein